MPNDIVEREIVGAGSFTPKDLQAISRKSYSFLNDMG